MKKYYKEYELLIDLPTGEKKGTHFFMYSDNNGGYYYEAGATNYPSQNGINQNGIKLYQNQMTSDFFKPIGKELPLYPKFPSINKIKEFYNLIGENKIVESVDEIRAINKIFYSDEFYNKEYELLKKMYNDRFYPNGE